MSDNIQYDKWTGSVLITDSGIGEILTVGFVSAL